VTQVKSYTGAHHTMPLIFTLAMRNLFHDRLRFIATLVGIVFSMILVTVQMGLYLGFGRMVTTMIDHAGADLWIMPLGTKCFEDASSLDESKRFRALSIKGVADAVPIVIGFAPWKMPGGGTSPVFVIGSHLRFGGLRPWNVVAGSIDALEIPGAVAIDRSYLERLGISGLGATAEIQDQKVEVRALTRGIRSFTTTPYAFAPLERARSYTGLASNKDTYILVRVAPDADVKTIRNRLQSNISDVEILTPAEFRDRSRSFWLFGTGAGAGLFAGALLGIIVGTVIVAQILYASTKDHLDEFATLRAIGSSSKYIYKVIICQAVLSAVIGFCIAAGIGLLIVRATAETALPIMITPALTLGLFALAVMMCVLSAVGAIAKVMRLDPAVVFTR
jgi:putative ABC transport system permease protein